MQFTYTVLTATLQAPSFFRSYQNSKKVKFNSSILRVSLLFCRIRIRKVVVSVTQSIYANPNWLHRIISSVIVINICSRVRKRMTLPGRKHYPLNLLKDHFSSLYFFAPWGTGSPAGVHLCRGPSCWV